MPYIGKSPVSGGFHKLGNLTASATDTYALTLNGAAYYPETANQLLCSLNGVIQAPQDSFTVSGSNLIFDTALTANDSIDFVVALGDVLGVGSVTDGAITTAKLGNNAVTDAKLATSLDMQNITLKGGTTDAISIDSSGRVEIKQNNTATSNYAASGAWTISGVPDWADKIKFVSYGISPDTLGDTYIRVTVGGTAVQGTAYKFSETRLTTGAGVTVNNYVSGTSQISVNGFNGIDNLFNWILQIYKIDTGIYGFNATAHNTTYAAYSEHFMGTIETSGAIDGFELIASGGNFDGGKARLFWE